MADTDSKMIQVRGQVYKRLRAYARGRKTPLRPRGMTLVDAASELILEALDRRKREGARK